MDGDQNGKSLIISTFFPRRCRLLLLRKWIQPDPHSSKRPPEIFLVWSTILTTSRGVNSPPESSDDVEEEERRVKKKGGCCKYDWRSKIKDQSLLPSDVSDRIFFSSSLSQQSHLVWAQAIFSRTLNSLLWYGTITVLLPDGYRNHGWAVSLLP